MKARTGIFTAIIVVLAITTSTSATAASITASSPEKIMRAMQEYGYVANLETDSVGDPKISSRVSRSSFSVFFYGCDNGSNCGSIQFSAGYNLNTGISALKINEWNSKKRFAKGFIDDEGDPFLRMDVNLDDDGVGSENFQDSLDQWRLLIEDFEEFIEW